MAETSFDLERYTSLHAARRLGLGTPISVQTVTGSTNDDALAAARAGAPHGATFVADTQTRGRGRRGQGWSSPPGKNLMVSVVLRPKLSAERASAITLCVGLAVRDVAQTRIAMPVQVKWPNDILVGNKKLAGILVESLLGSGRLTALVVGIGLNAAMRELPEEIGDVATSLLLCGAVEVQREPLLVELLAALDQRVTHYVRDGLEPVLGELSRHDALLGRRVAVDGVRGTARGIDASGALLVEDGFGILQKLHSGSVTLL